MCIIVVDIVVYMLCLRFLLLCVDVMVTASAYEVSCSGACGCGMSDVYMLKSMG